MEGNLIFDIETNGLYDQVSQMHCLVIKDVNTKETDRYNNGRTPTGKSFNEGLVRLVKATQEGRKIIAHNGIKYDVPVLEKLFPWFNPLKENVLDTLVLSRLIYADMGDSDARLMKSGRLPGKLFKSHSLEAWGYRLGNQKDDYDGGWENWSIDMEDYCEQDVHALETLYLHLTAEPYSEQAIKLEHDFCWIIARQERKGFLFDREKAVNLYGRLSQRRTELETELRQVFQPLFLRDGKTFTPKRDNKKSGYTADCTLSKIKLTEFNPGSRDHIAHWLKLMFKWVPKEFTETGKPKIDEDVLKPLQYPEAKLLCEYFMVQKRIGQLAEGDQAWLGHIKDDGRIHGSVNTNGAVTGRCSHSNPNIAQVPAVQKGKVDGQEVALHGDAGGYGYDCRELFTVPAGFKLVGADASALELRCLAGFMARWDGGRYIETVVNGKKEDGTEIHTVNRKALEIDSRDSAKTWFYAFVFGAGDHKLGVTLLDAADVKSYYQSNKQGIDKLYKQRSKGRNPVSKRDCVFIHRGRVSRDKFLKNLPALGKLTDAVKEKAKSQGYLKGLDGRKLHCRSEHSALNTLLQSAGALLMKQATVILDSVLQENYGFVPGVDYAQVASVHDELQLEVREEIAEIVGKECVAAMEAAGILFNFKCQITGEYKVGNNWAETH